MKKIYLDPKKMSSEEMYQALVALAQLEEESKPSQKKQPKKSLKKSLKSRSAQKKKYFCPVCKSKLTKIPLSNYRENGKLWHIPSFGQASCDKCGWVSRPLSF